MTYKEIIDIFKEKTTGHFFLNEFGYGDISDISTPDDGKSPMYPYVFLNPIAVNGGEQISTFNFNLICMTQTQDDEQSIIDAQSNSIDYLRDLISSVNYSITNPLVEFQEPFNFTPFKERFQDDVVGATVNMSVVYPTTLDLCKAPIAAPEDCLLFNTLTGDRNEGDTIFNTTFEFGGWGYLNANERNDYSGYTFTFECDTTYGYYIAKEGVDFTNSQGNSSDNNYPLLIYVKNSVNPAETGWWGTTVPSLPLNCGNQFPYTDHSQGLKIPVFNNNGWIYPTEGWAYSNRLGYNYLFSTNCNDPKPIPTGAPLPPPSVTPTPTSSVTPSITPTATVTPTITVTPSPTPSPVDCSVYETVCLGPLEFLPELNDTYTFWRTGEVHDLGGGSYQITCTGNTVMYTGVSTNNLIAFDTDTPIPELNAFNVTGGTIGCGNTVSVTKPSLQYSDPASLICGGNTYPDANDPTLSALAFGICPSPTPSVTPTITPTITPTSTVTPTQSVTATPTITPTTTITPTVTSTVTPSITPTSTVTPTSSVTATPSITPTSTVTPTQSVTATPSVTVTPSITPTNTVTPTPTPSASVPSGDADATAYLAAVVTAGGTTNATIDAAVQTLFTDLKTAGVYSKLNNFYPMVGGVAGSHAINANLDTAYDLTFAGGWTHNASGSTGNGSNAYADTSYQPFSETTVSATTFGYYNHKAISLTGERYTGTLNNVSPQQWFAFRNSSLTENRIGFGLNTITISLNSGQQGMLMFTTNSSNKFISHYNGTSSSPGSTILPPLPDFPVFMGALNLTGNPYGYTDMGFAFFFNSNYRLTSTELDDLATAINDFQTSLGRNTYT